LDKGYDYDEVYNTIQEFGFTAHARHRGEETTPSNVYLASTHAAGLWLNHWDKKLENYRASLYFA
jgi:hypothetical protein